ncbi:MAG: AAA family ATPase [Bacteriovoracales bacterium]|nr:AAA family ATPase [Bacteriovoracales bacterium]
MNNEVRQSIVEWLYGQKYWVQLATQKILEKKEITEEDIDELLFLLKCDNGESTDSSINFSFFYKETKATESFKIKSIGDVQGIEQILPKKPLGFGENLSVVYGNNGSGKSGYTRIFKRVFGKENNDLLQDVFKPKQKVQKCSIEVLFRNEAKKIEWTANSSNVTQLEPIDIFDSTTETGYIDKENESSYLPLEVSLFEDLVNVFKRIEEKLQREIEPASKLPKKPIAFSQEKCIDLMYNWLRPDSDIKELEEYYTFTDEDRKNKKTLVERLEGTPQVLLRKKQQQKTQIIALKNKMIDASNLVDQESCKEISKLYSLLKSKKEEVQEVARVLSNNAMLDAVGGDAWKAMWRAAKKYSEEAAYKNIDYPNLNDGARCVLCHQEIAQETKIRLKRFNEFVNKEVQIELQDIKNRYDMKIKNLPEKIKDESLKTLIQAAQLNEEEWLPRLKKIVESIEETKKRVLENNLDGLKLFGLGKNLEEDFKELISNISDNIETHKMDEESFDERKIKKDINDLKAKEWADSHIEAMIDEVERLKKNDRIKNWKNLVKTKNLSTKAGEIAENILTKEYIKRFNQELTSLGANNLQVELIKSKVSLGRVKHKLKLKGLDPSSGNIGLKPLSDGEKKVISLAAFLADIRGKPFRTPFVFDDPVSSLDNKYEKAIAKRLIRLSEDRQVIVFTHRLSFLGLLSTAQNVHQKYIKREDWGCGEHSDLPLFAKKPIGAIKNLKNDRLVKARNMMNRNGKEDSDPMVKSICTDFRILLERVIEIELMAGIVQRHERRIMTTGKIKNLSKISKEDCTLLDGKVMTRSDIPRKSIG